LGQLSIVTLGLNNILLNTAKNSLAVVRRRGAPKRRVKTIPLNNTCRALKFRLQSAKRLFKKYPQNPCIRGTYFKAAKRFKREVRRRKRQIKGQLIQNVESAQGQRGNQKEFWKGVSTLMGRTKSDDTEVIPHKE
jgi:hypothetical protein